MATEMAHPRRWRVLHDLREHGATLLTEARVTEITADSVHYVTGEDETSGSVATDSVVIATGLVGDRSVADAFEAAGFAPAVIGDCTGVGYLEGAISEGFHAGLAVG